jgi:voltage-gated potassium channel
MSPKHKFQIAISAIIGLLAFGTLGFKIMLGMGWFECFYFALITLTTIGYGEPPGMTEPARYFTSLLIILGVGTIGYALTAAAQAVVQFELISTFGKRKMFRDINKLNGHYIVCGSGRIGSGIVREIARRGYDFVVIEQDEATADKLLSQGYLVLMGDSTSDDVLRGAGIERARGLVCAVSSDPDNLYITLTARDINKDLYIISRANEESAIKRLVKAGANKVVSPSITGANQMAQMLLRPAVADFIELATMTEQLELEMEQIEITEGSPFINIQLKDTDIRSGLNVIIIAIKRKRGEMIFNPSADTVIEIGDALVAIGSHDNLEALERMTDSATPIRHRHS